MPPEDDIPSLDLLRCFAMLHRERHLSRAAQRTGISQPAMSRALARLRDRFDDPLFVRTPRGMLPTPRADALAPRVHAVIEAAASLVRDEVLDPAALVRTFVIGTSGFSDAQFLPPLIKTLAREAPHVAITTRSLGGNAGEALASGRLDLMIGIGESVPAGMRRTRLYQESFVCAVRRDHPGVGKRLTLERFIALPHLLIAPGGNPGSVVDSALEAQGLSRHVAARIHAFPSAPAIVAGTDLVLTAPKRLIEPLAKPFRLRLYPVPIELRAFPVFAAWHPRVQDDPAHAWFRGKVVAASKM
ncbi:MAG: LysR family transcriptional regulator [Minicystis sp.]